MPESQVAWDGDGGLRTVVQVLAAHRGSIGTPTSNDLPDFSNYEIITQQPLYRGELIAVRSWVHGTVLDVGANFGRFSELSRSTVSLDLGRKWLLRGRDLGKIKTAIVGSALNLPFKDKSFDTILAIGIAEHIPMSSIPNFLDEITRVAKARGRLVIRTTSPYSLFALLRLRLWDDYLHPYSPLRLRRELRRRGWQRPRWMSSGVLGVTSILPQTVAAAIPWARSVIQILDRD